MEVEIKGIVVNLPMVSESYFVGDDLDGEAITKIEDRSVLSDYDQIFHEIAIYTGKAITKTLINTPMSITYFGEEN